MYIDKKSLNDMLYQIDKCLNNMLVKFHLDIPPKSYRTFYLTY